MDWSKTKTIFIVVFSILNIFLYSLYVNQHLETPNMAVPGKTSVEELLKQENITYDIPSPPREDFSYLSASSVSFSKEELETLKNQTITIVDNTRIEAVMNSKTPVIDEEGGYLFDDFLLTYVYHGEEYMLGEINEEDRTAIFFQRAKDEPIFYSSNAMITLHWDEDGFVTSYEQRMLEKFYSYNRKKDLLTQDEAVASLVTRGHVRSGSTIKKVTIGYSTLVQLSETQTQVFAPTWNIRVELKDGETEDYFVNAIEGKIIDFQLDKKEETEMEAE